MITGKQIHEAYEAVERTEEIQHVHPAKRWEELDATTRRLYDLTAEKLNAEHPAITRPSIYPAPKFHFGQTAYIKDSDNEHGIIFGMACRTYKHAAWAWRYAIYVERWGYFDDWYDEEQISLEKWPEAEEA